MRVAGNDELGGTLVCKIFDRYGQRGYASANEAIRAVIGEKPQNGNVSVGFNFVQILLIFDGWAQGSRVTNKIPQSAPKTKARILRQVTTGWADPGRLLSALCLWVKTQPAVTPRGFTLARMNSMMLSMGVPG